MFLLRNKKNNFQIHTLICRPGPEVIKLFSCSIDPFHIVISLSNRSSIEKSIKPFLKMKGQIAY